MTLIIYPLRTLVMTHFSVANLNRTLMSMRKRRLGEGNHLRKLS